MTDAKRMMDLFRGYANAYGTYEVDETQRDARGKVKGRAVTLRKPVTEALWQGHLDGEQGIGIITITEDDMCWWGCIDVDSYNINHSALVQRVEDLSLQLHVARSKSGGAHVYLLTSEAVPAWLMQFTLKSLAAVLGIGGSEIFPKQTSLNKEREDLGSWVNMPYHDAAAGMRYVVNATGAAVSLSMWLDLAYAARYTAEGLAALSEQSPAPPTPGAPAASGPTGFTDGPVCLEVMTKHNKIAPGSRNMVLLNMGVYAKKRYPETWEAELERMNTEHFDPPLPAEEVVQIRRNLRRKQYFYQCKDDPLKAHCNSSLCRTRTCGVSDEEIGVSVNGLRKLDAEPPIWYLDVEGYGTLELTTDQLHSSSLFVKSCMEQLNFRPAGLSPKLWGVLLQEAFEKLTIIDMPEEDKLEASVGGEFHTLYQDFMGRPAASEWSEILLRKVYRNGEGQTYFRFTDLLEFLKRRGFRDWTRAKITAELRALGAEPSGQRKIEGTPVRLWRVSD